MLVFRPILLCKNQLNRLLKTDSYVLHWLHWNRFCGQGVVSLYFELILSVILNITQIYPTRVTFYLDFFQVIIVSEIHTCNKINSNENCELKIFKNLASLLYWCIYLPTNLTWLYWIFAIFILWCLCSEFAVLLTVIETLILLAHNTVCVVQRV